MTFVAISVTVLFFSCYGDQNDHGLEPCIKFWLEMFKLKPRQQVETRHENKNFNNAAVNVHNSRQREEKLQAFIANTTQNCWCFQWQII